jgi:hypothetical protein
MEEFGILSDSDFGGSGSVKDNGIDASSAAAPAVKSEQENEVAALKGENTALKAELEKLRAQLAASDPGLAQYEGVQQRPVAQIKFHHASKQIRRKLDGLLSNLEKPLLDADAPTLADIKVKVKVEVAPGDEAEDGEWAEDEAPKANGKAGKVSSENGSVQYFETFCIDRFGVTNMPRGVYQAAECEMFEVPNYMGAANAYALPVHEVVDGKRTVAVKQGCFNCGKPGHSIGGCAEPKNDQIVRANSRMFRENPVGGSKKRERFRGRYHEQEQEDAAELARQEAPSAPDSGIRVIDDAASDQVAQAAKRQRVEPSSSTPNHRSSSSHAYTPSPSIGSHYGSRSTTPAPSTPTMGRYGTPAMPSPMPGMPPMPYMFPPLMPGGIPMPGGNHVSLPMPPGYPAGYQPATPSPSSYVARAPAYSPRDSSRHGSSNSGSRDRDRGRERDRDRKDDRSRR